MGTRADFYIGIGKDAEWLGSIAWDGYPSGIPEHILDIKDELEFRNDIREFLESRDDGTLPDKGWPWPWEDSRTTDYSYAFIDGKVKASCFGNEWFDPLNEEEIYKESSSESKMIYPNMKDKQKTTFGKRSGVILFRG